eukprot:278784-Hanusia_phi.AAC.1
MYVGCGLISRKRREPCVLVRSSGVHLSGIAISQIDIPVDQDADGEDGGGMSGEELPAPSAVIVEDGNLSMENCYVSASFGSCISLKGPSSISLKNCRIMEGFGHGLVLEDGSHGLLIDCDVASNKGAGVVVCNQSKLIMERSQVDGGTRQRGGGRRQEAGGRRRKAKKMGRSRGGDTRDEREGYDDDGHGGAGKGWARRRRCLRFRLYWMSGSMSSVDKRDRGKKRGEGRVGEERASEGREGERRGCERGGGSDTVCQLWSFGKRRRKRKSHVQRHL